MRWSWVLVLLMLLCGCGVTRVRPATTCLERESQHSAPSTTERSVWTVEVEPQRFGREDCRVEIAGETVVGPPGAKLRVEREIVKSVSGGQRWSKDRAEAVGAGVRSGTGELIDKLDLQPPRVSVDNGISGQAGSMSLAVKSANSGMAVLYVIGSICMVVGIVVVVLFKQVGLGFGVAGGGLVLVVVARALDKYPWVALLGLFVVLGFAALFLFRLWRERRQASTLSTIVEVIERAPYSESEPIKEAVSLVSKANGNDKVVKDEVTRIKRAARLSV